MVDIRKGIRQQTLFDTRNMRGSTVQRSNARAFPASDACLHPAVGIRRQGVPRKPRRWLKETVELKCVSWNEGCMTGRG